MQCESIVRKSDTVSLNNLAAFVENESIDGMMGN